MFGYGRRWFRGIGRAYNPAVSAPEGYVYIGPCRCGFGPEAYYQDTKTGRIVHASQLYRRAGMPSETSAKEELKAELSALKEEKELLEKRIKELEELIKE